MSRLLDTIRGIQFVYGLGAANKKVELIISDKDIIENQEKLLYLMSLSVENYAGNLYNGMVRFAELYESDILNIDSLREYLLLGVGVLLEQEGYLQYSNLGKDWVHALEKYLYDYLFMDKHNQNMFLMYMVVLELSIKGGVFDDGLVAYWIKSFACTEYAEYAKPYVKKVVKLLYGLGL